MICPTGAGSKILSSPLCKNISLHPSGKSSLQIRAIPPHNRGVSRSSRTRDGMRWTRQRFARNGIAGQVERRVSGRRHADERCCSGRQNRVVLTPRRWCQVCGVASAQPGLDKTYPWTTVANKPGHRGEHEISRKTIACGNAGRFRCTRLLVCIFTNAKRARGRGCNGHPAFPTPSFGADDSATPRALRAARARTHI